MKNCQNCGQANVDDAKFCELCGMQLDGQIQMKNWDWNDQKLMDKADRAADKMEEYSCSYVHA